MTLWKEDGQRPKCTEDRNKCERPRIDKGNEEVFEIMGMAFKDEVHGNCALMRIDFEALRFMESKGQRVSRATVRKLKHVESIINRHRIGRAGK